MTCSLDPSPASLPFSGHAPAPPCLSCSEGPKAEHSTPGVASQVPSTGAWSPPCSCWPHYSWDKPGCCWPSWPPGHTAGSCSAGCRPAPLGPFPLGSFPATMCVHGLYTHFFKKDLIKPLTYTYLKTHGELSEPRWTRLASSTPEFIWILTLRLDPCGTGKRWSWMPARHRSGQRSPQFCSPHLRGMREYPGVVLPRETETWSQKRMLQPCHRLGHWSDRMVPARHCRYRSRRQRR